MPANEKSGKTDGDSQDSVPEARSMRMQKKRSSPNESACTGTDAKNQKMDTKAPHKNGKNCPCIMCNDGNVASTSSGHDGSSLPASTHTPSTRTSVEKLSESDSSSIMEFVETEEPPLDKLVCGLEVSSIFVGYLKATCSKGKVLITEKTISFLINKREEENLIVTLDLTDLTKCCLDYCNEPFLQVSTNSTATYVIRDALGMNLKPSRLNYDPKSRDKTERMITFVLERLSTEQIYILTGLFEGLERRSDTFLFSEASKTLTSDLLVRLRGAIDIEMAENGGDCELYCQKIFFGPVESCYVESKIIIEMDNFVFTLEGTEKTFKLSIPHAWLERCTAYRYYDQGLSIMFLHIGPRRAQSIHRGVRNSIPSFSCGDDPSKEMVITMILSEIDENKVRHIAQIFSTSTTSETFQFKEATLEEVLDFLTEQEITSKLRTRVTEIPNGIVRLECLNVWIGTYKTKVEGFTVLIKEKSIMFRMKTVELEFNLVMVTIAIADLLACKTRHAVCDNDLVLELIIETTPLSSLRIRRGLKMTKENGYDFNPEDPKHRRIVFSCVKPEEMKAEVLEKKLKDLMKQSSNFLFD